MKTDYKLIENLEAKRFELHLEVQTRRVEKNPAGRIMKSFNFEIAYKK